MIHTTPKLRLLLLLSLLAAGCHPRGNRPETKQRELMHTSFEELGRWTPDVLPTLTTEKAHSGKFSVRVDKQHQYSPTYKMDLGVLSTHRPRRFTLSGWVWVPSDKDDAVIVVAITDPGNPDHPIFRKDVYLTDGGGYQQWKHVSRSMDLPGNVHANSQLVVYLWHANAFDPVYADDLKLTELW